MKHLVHLVKKSKTFVTSNHTTRQVVFFTIFSVSIIILSLVVLSRQPVNRSVFYFFDRSNVRVRAEVRLLSDQETLDGRLLQYVSELILGPIHDASVPLFPSGTTVESAFIRGRDAYIHLVGPVVDVVDERISFYETWRLFEKNVFTNFRNVARIYMYANGIEVYGGDHSADAEFKKRKMR